MTDQETLDALQSALNSVKDAIGALAQVDGMTYQLNALQALEEGLEAEMDELESLLESESDGQPDEMQEWADVDPDC